MNEVAIFAPAVNIAVAVVQLVVLDGAIKRDPCHDFGVGELFASAAGLPDTFVRLLPDLAKVIDQTGLECRGIEANIFFGLRGARESGGYFTEDVELELPGCGVADADGG